MRACRSPLKQIVENAGEDGDVVANKVLENKDQNYGYDARAGEYCDMVKEGIIDPTKVVRSALQNAASVATLLLTSDALVAEMPRRREEGRRPAAATTTCIENGQFAKPQKPTERIRGLLLFPSSVCLRPRRFGGRFGERSDAGDRARWRDNGRQIIGEVRRRAVLDRFGKPRRIGGSLVARAIGMVGDDRVARGGSTVRFGWG